jgi:hypothetical protein
MAGRRFSPSIASCAYATACSGTKALGWAYAHIVPSLLHAALSALIGEPKRDSSISSSPPMPTMVRGIDALRRKSQMIEK